MTKSMKMLVTGFAGLMMAGGIAAAATMLTAKNGMTLYTFDNDKGAESTCYDACATNWPPYMAAADVKMGEGWTTVKRKDGKMQWAYDGHPMYFFKGDKKKGDAMGDGMKGIWHVVME